MIEVGQSYGGYGWYGEADITCAGSNGNIGSTCTLNVQASEVGQYRVDAWETSRRPLLNHTASRMLVQSTFGPTRKSIANFVNNFNSPIDWLNHQMNVIPPSYLRSYYRQRTNPRMHTAIKAGTLRNYECEVGTRWHTYSITAADQGKILQVYAGTNGRTANTFTLEIDGYKRTETTEWNGETWSPSSSDQTWYLCYVYEQATNPGDDIKMAINSQSSCTKESNKYPTNPTIHFATPDLSMTRVYTSSQVELINPVPSQRSEVFILKTIAPNICTGNSVHKGTNIFMKVDTKYYRLDPRLKLITNTMNSPANVDQSFVNSATPGQCPSVKRSFVNDGSCVQRTSTCAPITFNSATIPLNETTLKMWYSKSQRYVHHVSGLRLENDYNVSPCISGISRWKKIINGACTSPNAETSNLQGNTQATIRSVLIASTDTSNPYIRDVDIDKAQLGSCTTTNSVGAIIQITNPTTSNPECWQHVHPDTYNVYDASIWTVIHDGNQAAKQGQRPNPITAFALSGLVAIQYPSNHPMTRWKDRKKHFNFIGRYGESVQFQSLPVELQTLSMARVAGAIQSAPDSGFEACGSRGEVANDPFLGHQYQFTSKFNDIRILTEELDYPLDQHDSKSNIWVNVALKSKDQLRQRVAWSLSQILVIAEEGIGKSDENEPWTVFYDIFVKHAFGNYHDILREVSYSPMMSIYLTYHQNKAYQFAGTYPDENYAREIMQLFTIGLWELNNDGTLKDTGTPNEYIPTYDNYDIMSFSRIWTGLDTQQSRGNVECRQGESATNIFDSTDIKPQWRDQYPKTSLSKNGYIGDTYPLCHTPGRRGSFLMKGSTYKLTGEHSEEGSTFDNTQSNIDQGRFTPNSVSSSLYLQLCGPRDGNNKCTWPTEVKLASTLACDGIECNIDRIRTVKMIDGTNVRWYSYVPSPCVTMTFFNGVRISSRHTDSRWSCANPITPVASPMCCDASDSTTMTSDAPTGTWYFAAEMTTLETAKERCASNGLQQCSMYSETRSARLKRQTSSADVYSWTRTNCNVRVQVHPNGDINVVDDDVNYPTGTRNEYALNNDNKFKVRWTDNTYPIVTGTTCGTSSHSCQVGYASTCICTTNTTNTVVYNELSLLVSINKKELLNKLFIGASNNFIDSSENIYTKCTTTLCNSITSNSIKNGITSVWFKKTKNGNIGVLDKDTIFEIKSNIIGNAPYTLYNRQSIVYIGDDINSGSGSVSLSFRNPPKFMPMFGERNTGRTGFPASFDKPQAYHETDALIKHLFEHSNTAPFVSHRLIQRMVTSNPSPRYVDSVATAFRTGTYNGITYSGKYGDLKATVMAILLDREARSHVLDDVPSFGKLREPLLKVLHVMRSLEYTAIRGRDVFFSYMEQKVGQWAFNSPTVFSYFLPEYQPPGEILNNNLVSPEAELGTAPLMIGFLNGMKSLIDYGLTGCKRGFGSYQNRPNRKCDTRIDRSFNIYNTNDGTLKYSSIYSIEWIVHELNTLLTSGRMNENTIADIIQQYNAVTRSNPRTGNQLTYYGPGNTKKDATNRILKIFMLSSEFHSTSMNSYTSTTRTDSNPVVSSGRSYKAIIVLFMAGAADSYNMLVPTTGCNSNHDLYQEYKTIRGNAALDTSELLDIVDTSNTQPCTNFGIHGKLQVVKDAYDRGEAAWIANMGSLLQPTTKQQFKDKSVPLPPSLFAHNVMQKSIATMHPQLSSSSGILGRITNILSSRQNQPYKTELYSISGPQKIVTGGPTPNIISGSEGVTKYEDYDLLRDIIHNLTKYTSSSYMADTYSGMLRSNLDSTEALGDKLEATTVTAMFNEEDLSSQFKQIAKVIKIHRDPSTPTKDKVERAAFVTKLGGFDTHRDLAETLEKRMITINNALKSFEEEMKTHQQAWNDVVIVTISDFGRTLTSNGLGTDHAWGGNYFVMGGDIDGKKIHGKYPSKLGEENGDLNIGRGRLIPTTSWNSLWKPVAQWFGIQEGLELDTCLPNHKKFPNILDRSDLFK